MANHCEHLYNNPDIREKIYTWYFKEFLSSEQIGWKLGCSDVTARKLLRSYGFKPRTRKQSREVMKKDGSWSWFNVEGRFRASRQSTYIHD